MIVRSVLVLALLTGLTLPSSAAEKVNRNVTANRSTSLGGISTFDKRNCQAGPVPRAKIVKAPKHGKATLKPHIFPIKKDKCKGSISKGMNVIYTPTRGYRGPDQLTVKFTYPLYFNHPGNVSRSYDFILKVK